MKLSRLVALPILGLVGLVGCSDALNAANPFPEKNGACDFRPNKAQCTDWRKYQGPSMSVMEGTCTSGQGKWTADSTCPVDGMLGGCQSESGGTLQTNWYYPDDNTKTVDDVKKKCSDDGTTFVNPS